MTGINEWIDAAQRRCDEATEGPWYAKPNDLIGGWCVMSQDVTPAEAPRGVRELADFARQEDATFIAAARTDLPTALAALTDLLNACDESVEGIVEVYGTDDMAVAVLTVDEVRSIIATALGVAP